MPDDYDSPWKEIIEQYFTEFIDFFFPKAYKDIDWKKGYEFLDKELRQITKDAEIGRKHVDKPVRVWLRSGDDAWVLIHADIQSRYEEDFSKRMYVYNSPYASDLTPPSPFPERAGGVNRRLPSPFRGGAGEGFCVR